jgi:hypothetical protein
VAALCEDSDLYMIVNGFTDTGIQQS